MTYRNDYDALLARNAALETEVRHLRDRLQPPTKPLRLAPVSLSFAAQWKANVDAARIELEFLLADRIDRERRKLVVGSVLATCAMLLLSFAEPIFFVGALCTVAIALCVATKLHPITGERSRLHRERVMYLQAQIAAYDSCWDNTRSTAFSLHQRLSARADSAPSGEA